MKKVRVILSSEAAESYELLRKSPGPIFKAVESKIKLMKKDPHYGKPIAKKLIPAEYVMKYSVTNLFRIELPNFWRMLYTLTCGENETEMISFVLDIVDHKLYDKKFGYRH